MMLYLLYPVIFAEMLLILIFLIRSPLRVFMIRGLDRMKRGKGRVVGQTLMGTLIVLFVSHSLDVYKHLKATKDAISVNPTDQVLTAYHLLEATLLGIALFLSLIIDRLHYYVKEIQRLRKTSEDYQLHSEKEQGRED